MTALTDRASGAPDAIDATTGPRPRAAAARRALLLALALFAAMAVVVVLGRPLLPIDETRYLTVAWEMRRDGTWLVPRLNGEIYGHKPPLLFWLVNGAWSVAGVGEAAARLVTPLFGLAAVALTAALGRALWPGEPGRAALAALILATTGAFLVYATGTTFDGMLTAAVAAAMLALARMRRGGGAGAVLGLGAALALGAYAKGPVVLVHVLPVALLMPAWARGARPAYGRWLRDVALAGGVALALVGMWLVPALLAGGPEYRTEVLWRQSAGRVAGAFGHPEPAWFFLVRLPLYLWPWGWTAAGLAALAPWRLRASEPSRLLAVWAVGGLVLFSLIGGKLTHYLLPELPALALLLAGAAPGTLPGGGRRWPRLLPLAPALALLAAGGAVHAGLVPDAVMNEVGVGAGDLAGGAAVLVALAAATLAPRGPLPGLILCAPLTILLLLAVAGPLLRAGYDARPLGRVLAAAEAERGVGSVGVADSTYHGQFNWAGRLQGLVARLHDPAARAAWAARHPGGVILSREALPDPGLVLEATRGFHGKDYRAYRVGRRHDGAP